MCKTFTSHNTGNVLSPQNFRSIINYNTHILLILSTFQTFHALNDICTNWIQQKSLLQIHGKNLLNPGIVLQLFVCNSLNFSGEVQLSTNACFISNNTGNFFFWNFEDLPNSNGQAFTKNIHKNKTLNWPKFICSKRTTLGKAYGTHVVLLGTCWGNRVRTWRTFWELDGNDLGTSKIQKVQLPSPFPKGKRKETKQSPWGACFLSSLAAKYFNVSSACFSPFLAY